MIKTELPENIQRAIQSGIPLHDVIHGELNNLMVQWQDKKFDINKQDWAEGYQDCLTDIYGLCYDVIFYQQDMERKNGNCNN